MNDTYWCEAIISYVLLALATFVPVLYAMLQKVTLKTGEEEKPWWHVFGNRKDGDKKDKEQKKLPFDDSFFSEEAKRKLNGHFARIEGTRIFWKNQAEWYRRFHYYSLYWTVPVSVIIPIIVQLTDGEMARYFLTVISTHVAIIFGLHRALKVESNVKVFRLGESEFYDTYRRMLDRPESFGKEEAEQLKNYFIDVENIRRHIRQAEADNFPSVEKTEAN